MARIKVESPDKIIFNLGLPVRITDINYGGHMGNDVVLKYLHEVRMNFLRSVGIKDEISIDQKIGWIIADAALEYKAEAFFGNEIIISLGIADIHKYGFSMIYLLHNKDSGKEIARAKTGMIFFNYSTRKIAHAPEDFMKKVNDLPAI